MRHLLILPMWLLAMSAYGLTNGLALTPPMGWSSWYGFLGNYDETVLRETADAMTTNGLQAAGYNFVILDDCYTTGRDTNGNLVVDPVRFPSGMNSLGAYLHSKGLGFGVYMVASTWPGYCGGPPSYTNEARDVATSVSWGIDVLRVDGLGGLGVGVTEEAEPVATRWRDALRATGQPVLLSLLGGYFEHWKPSVGNMYRISLDINASWYGVTNNLDLMNRSARYAGPGHWTDPDMVFVGNMYSRMNDVENRAFFSLWCITASPLILGSDVRRMTAATKAIVTAPELIALDQEPLGAQGIRISSIPASGGNLEVWCKQLTDPNTKAVALFNQSAAAANMTVSWTNLLLQPGNATVRDLWARADLGTFITGFTTNVPSHGAVVLKITGSPYAPPVFLSTLSHAGMTGTVNFDRSSGNYFGFPVLNFGEVYYPTGLEMETPASVTYDLAGVDGIVTRFVADIGIDKDSYGYGAAIFQVWADGEKLLETAPVSSTNPIQTVTVDLAGRHTLKLATVGTGHADWGDARILVWPHPGPPTYVVAVGTNGPGSVAASALKASYTRGELVQLVATPERWHSFAQWNDGVTNNPRLISVESNASFTASFVPVVPLETVNYGGVARVAPVGMPAIFVNSNFIISGRATVVGTARIALQSTFGDGLMFYALEGPGGASLYDFYTGPFTLTNSATVRSFVTSADFSQLVEGDPVEVVVFPPYPLVVTTLGGGNISLDPPKGPYPSNTTVVVTAWPAPGWNFLYWTGTAEGTNASINVTMDRSKTLQAVFGTPVHTATLGTGSVHRDPERTLHPFGSLLRLTAVPGAGNFFKLWGNAVSNVSNPLDFRVTNANHTVTALFLPLLGDQVALTVIESHGGTVNRDPSATYYTSGQSVTLTAQAAPGFEFTGWSGDATGVQNPLALTLSSSKTLTAHFRVLLRLAAQMKPTGCLINLTGANGTNYVLQVSSDLSNWASITNLVTSSGNAQFLDSAATNLTHRFYRALLMEP